MTTASPSAEVSSAAAQPAISFADEQGRPVNLDTFKGNVVILEIWATWCKPCRDEFPVLERLKPQGLSVVPVSVDHRGLSTVDAFYQQLKIVNLAKYTGNMNEITKTFALRGLPSTFLLDRDGREVLRVEGVVSWESAEIGTVLTTLLAR
jgi:thiol-disulfide isomerase/thioredoxin